MFKDANRADSGYVLWGIECYFFRAELGQICQLVGVHFGMFLG